MSIHVSLPERQANVTPHQPVVKTGDANPTRPRKTTLYYN